MSFPNIIQVSVLILLFRITVAYAEPDKSYCLKMSTVSEASEDLSYLGSNFKMLMEHAGYCIELLAIPVARSHEMLLKGELDGHVVASQDYEKSVSDIAIRVDEPFGSTEGWIVYREEEKIRSIGVVRGANWQIAGVNGYFNKLNTMKPKHSLIHNINSVP